MVGLNIAEANLRDDEERSQDLLPDFVWMTVSNMNFWFCRFVAEAKCVDGQPYPPNMLYQICCALLQALREKDRADVNFFSDPKFSAFKYTVDAKMKELQASGKYMLKKEQPITIEHEDILWEMGLLGDHSLQALIDTLCLLYRHVFCVEKWRGASMSQVPSSTDRASRASWRNPLPHVL